jgi:hypothetical protein
MNVIQWVYIGYSSKGLIPYIFLYSYTFKNEKPVVLDEVPFNIDHMENSIKLQKCMSH